MIIWNELAENELKVAYDWYESKRYGLGDALILCIDAALARLENHPFIGTPICDDVRRILIKRYPYGIYHRVIKGDIIVVGFRHFRQESSDFIKIK